MKILLVILMTIWNMLCGILDGGSRKYDQLYRRIIKMAMGPEFDIQLGRLPEAAKPMYFAAVLDMEVQNGGICQFFANCGPDIACRVSDSLRAIGLEAIAGLYDEFVGKYGIDVNRLEDFRAETAEEFSALYKLYPYDEFDGKYMQLHKELKFSRTMLNYAKAHPEAFEQAERQS